MLQRRPEQRGEIRNRGRSQRAAGQRKNQATAADRSVHCIEITQNKRDEREGSGRCRAHNHINTEMNERDQTDRQTADMQTDSEFKQQTTDSNRQQTADSTADSEAYADRPEHPDNIRYRTRQKQTKQYGCRAITNITKQPEPFNIDTNPIRSWKLGVVVYDVPKTTEAVVDARMLSGQTKEKMFEFKTKKPEESSTNWKPWHKDWDPITSNHSEDDAINDDGKYRYNRKGFLEDDESCDDSILIVNPGWDDYCLQTLKLNRHVPLCLEARRARMKKVNAAEALEQKKQNVEKGQIRPEL
ncbi:hypothetical protein Tco_0180571 [Tanacetum coccineum]